MDPEQLARVQALIEQGMSEDRAVAQVLGEDRAMSRSGSLGVEPTAPLDLEGAGGVAQSLTPDVSVQLPAEEDFRISIPGQEELTPQDIATAGVPPEAPPPDIEVPRVISPETEAQTQEQLSTAFTGRDPLSLGQQAGTAFEILDTLGNTRMVRMSPQAPRVGGAGNLQVSQSTTVRPPVPEALQEQMRLAAERAANARRLALAGQLGSIEELGRLQEETADDLQSMQDTFQQMTDTAQAESEAQLNEVRQSLDTLAGMNVNPTRFWADRGEASQFLGAVAVGMGALAQSLVPGTANTALSIINSAVERDINAQVANIQKQQGVARGQFQLLDSLRAKYQDDVQALNVLRQLRLQQAQMSARRIALRYQQPAVMAQYQQLEAQIQQQMAQLQAEFLQRQFETTFETRFRTSRRSFQRLLQQTENHARALAGMPTTETPAQRRAASRGSGPVPPRPTAQAPGGDQVVGRIQGRLDSAAAREQLGRLRAQFPGQRLLARETPEGLEIFTSSANVEAASQQDLEARRSASARSFGPGITFDPAVAASLPETAATEIRGFVDAWSRSMNRIDELRELIGFSLSPSTRAQAQVSADNLVTALGQTAGAGALAEGELEFFRGMTADPTGLFGSVTAEARLGQLERIITSDLEQFVHGRNGRFSPELARAPISRPSAGRSLDPGDAEVESGESESSISDVLDPLAPLNVIGDVISGE